MKNVLIAAVFMLMSCSAMAEVSLSGLSDAQRAAIETQAAQMRQENAQKKMPGVPASASVNQWIDVGANLGKALAGAAKEVNVAVNDFVKSPVGMITAGIIIWQFIGGALVHLFGALIVLTFGFSVLWWATRNSYQTTIEYDTTNQKEHLRQFSEAQSNKKVCTIRI